MESKRSPYLKHIYVCTHQRQPGEKILEKLKGYVQQHGLKDKV